MMLAFACIYVADRTGRQSPGPGSVQNLIVSQEIWPASEQDMKLLHDLFSDRDRWNHNKIVLSPKTVPVAEMSPDEELTMESIRKKFDEVGNEGEEPLLPDFSTVDSFLHNNRDTCRLHPNVRPGAGVEFGEPPWYGDKGDALPKAQTVYVWISRPGINNTKNRILLYVDWREEIQVGGSLLLLLSWDNRTLKWKVANEVLAGPIP